MAEVDLRFIGERLERVQAELRDLRAIKGEVVHLRAELARVEMSLSERIDRLEASVDERFNRIDARFAHIDDQFAHIDDRFDRVDDRVARLDRSFDARLDQVHQTMATNFAIVFELLNGGKATTGA